MFRLHCLMLAIIPFAVACTGDAGMDGSDGASGPAGPTGPQGAAGSRATAPTVAGAVDLTSNDAAHNEVWAIARYSDGSLNEAWAFGTGGVGTAASLADQGAVFLDATAKRVFAVNAGSNTVSMFSIDTDRSLALVGTPTSSGGVKPISVAESGGTVYVLNAGDVTNAPNIAGFSISATGMTSNSVSLALSTAVSATAAVAQISFTPDGKHLVVSEKGTGKLDTYEVSNTGVATGPQVQNAAGGAGSTPYGFAFSSSGTLLVTEAAGAVSSYTISGTGALTAMTSSLTTHQAAPCWLAASGTWGWAINAGSDSVTGYNVGADGTITLTASSGVAASTANKPLDAALSSDGNYLYVLNANDHSISIFDVNADGSLKRRPDFLGLPAFAEGIAVQ